MSLSYCLIAGHDQYLNLSPYFQSIKKDYVFLEKALNLNLVAIFSLPTESSSIKDDTIHYLPIPAIENVPNFILNTQELIARLTSQKSLFNAVDEALFSFFSVQYENNRKSLRLIDHPRERNLIKEGYCNHCPKLGELCTHFNACQFVFCYTSEAFLLELNTCLNLALKAQKTNIKTLYFGLL